MIAADGKRVAITAKNKTRANPAGKAQCRWQTQGAP